MKRTTVLSFFVAGLIVAAPAHAQWYAGASVGGTDAKLFSDAQDPGYFLARGFTNAKLQFDKRDTGYRAFAGYDLGGYDFLKNFAIELGHVDLGKINIRTDAMSNAGGAGSIINDTKIKGDDLSIVARHLNVGDVTIFARLGVFVSEAKSTVSSSGSVALLGNDNVSYKKHSTKATYGLGAEYPIAPKLFVRGEWSRFDKFKTADVLGAEREASINLYTLGVTYRF